MTPSFDRRAERETQCGREALGLPPNPKTGGLTPAGREAVEHLRELSTRIFTKEQELISQQRLLAALRAAGDTGWKYGELTAILDRAGALGGQPVGQEVTADEQPV